MSLSEVLAKSDNRGGATDCSAPILWATEHRHHVDGFLMLTDNESWAGYTHPSQALREYRRKVNPNARVIWAAVAANGHTSADPSVPGVINYTGFDSALPLLVSQYLGPQDRVG